MILATLSMAAGRRERKKGKEKDGRRKRGGGREIVFGVI
jgi:hypothetical protein